MIKRFSEGEPFRCIGHEFAMLIPRDATECCEAVLQTLPPSGATPPNAHDTFVQVYLIVAGEAKVAVGEDVREIEAPGVAFVPLNATHHVENLSSEAPLQYVYVSVWANGIPSEEREGGWREVYGRIEAEYAARGYGAGARADGGDR